MSDEELVQALRGGNDAAVEVLFDRYHQPLLGYCAQILGSRAEAEDALQQVLFSAVEDLRKSERAVNLKPWLYRIAHNRCISMLRSRKEPAVDIAGLQISTATGLGEEVEQRGELQDLLRSLARLPVAQREALVLLELGDLSGPEIAEAVGVSPQKAHELVYQARQSLLADRDASELECLGLRRKLASWKGVLTKLPRRHLEICDGCRVYYERVRAQRAALALVLPIVPSEEFAEAASAALRSRLSGIPANASSEAARAGTRRNRRRGFAFIAGCAALVLAVSMTAEGEPAPDQSGPAPDEPARGTAISADAAATFKLLDSPHERSRPSERKADRSEPERRDKGDHEPQTESVPAPVPVEYTPPVPVAPVAPPVAPPAPPADNEPSRSNDGPGRPDRPKPVKEEFEGEVVCTTQCIP